MPTALTCTGCSSPIDIPADHEEPTIRCGICWTEVTIPKSAGTGTAKPAARASTAPVAKAIPATPVPPVSTPRVAAALPAGAKPTSGMAPLEALLTKANARLTGTGPQTALPGGIPKAAPLPSSAIDDVEILEPEILDAPAPAVVAPSLKPLAAPPPAVPTIASGGRKTRTRDDDDDKPKTRYKTRAERDDDDLEDEDEKPSGKKSGRGAGILLIVGVGVFLLVGFGISAYFVVNSFMSDSPDVDPDLVADLPPGVNFNPNPNPNPLPGLQPPDPVQIAPLPNNVPNPDQNPRVPVQPRPQPPRPNRPVPEVTWVPVDGADGFKALFPGKAHVFNTWQENIHDTSNFLTLGKGKKYTGNDKGYSFDITFADVPAGATPDLRKILTGSGQPRGEIVECKTDGHPGLEVESKNGPILNVKRVVQVGPRIFIFSATLHPIFGRTEEHAEEARKTFFESIKITFDKDTPAVEDPNRPRLPPPQRPGFPGNPGRPNPPPGRPGGNMKNLQAKMRIDPFWTSLYLPKQQEVLVFGARQSAGGRPGGYVRRYSYPDFLPKAMYHLPNPVTFAVADDAAGLLMVTTSTRQDIAQKEIERQVHIGDIQVYNLNQILSGKLGERDDLKPTSSIQFGARLAGMELIDSKLYVLTISPSGNRVKPWRPKLVQLDHKTGKTLAEMDLPDPAWRMAVSPDKSKIYIGEVQLSPLGLPMWGVGNQGFILVVDAKEMTKERTLSVPGTIYDLVVREDGTVLASVSEGPGVKLYAVNPSGLTVDLTSPSNRKESLGYIGLTPDGSKLITAVPREFGIAIHDVTNLEGPSGLKQVVDARAVKSNGANDSEVPIGGNFTITPDQRFALFQVGLVVDLESLK